jgi:hypothetical protein
MKRIRLEWLLPTVQLALALFCNVYGPHEYRVASRRDRAVNNMEYFLRHNPGLAERISKGINFPALVLDYPLRNEDGAIYERNSDYTLIWIAPREIGFFVGVVLFWYWAGRKLGPRRERSHGTTWPHEARTAGLILGIVFGTLAGAYATQMIASRWRPENQIGGFGIVWSLGLITYFGWQMKRNGNGRGRKRVGENGSA